MLKKKFEAAGKSTFLYTLYRFLFSPVIIAFSAFTVYVITHTESPEMYLFAFAHCALIILVVSSFFLLNGCDKTAFCVSVAANVFTFVLYAFLWEYAAHSSFRYLPLVCVMYFICLMMDRKIFFCSLEEIQADKKEADEKLAQSLAAFNGGGGVKESAADEIAKFKKLLDEDAITQEEYEKQKQKILGFNATTAK